MKTEKVLVIITIIAIFLKFFHVPGGAPLLALSLLILALLYFPFGFYFLSDKSYKENTITSIVFGWLLSICFIGIMFRIMHWPGAMGMNLIGAMTALPLTIFVFFKHKNAIPEKNIYYRNLLIRSSVLLILSILLSFIILPF